MTDSRFSTSIKGTKPAMPILPLVHTCQAHTFRTIFENQMILPSPCDVFTSDLLVYLFYGKPSYRTSRDKDSISLTSFFPVCFVISAPMAILPKRVFPLDSGAFNEGMFKDYFHNETKLDDLKLQPNIESAQKVVSHFFGSNENYFNANINNINFDPIEFEVESYIELIKTKSKTKFDDRRSSIELQYDFPIDLASVSILLVILPTRFLDDPKILSRIVNDWNAETRTYNITHANPNECMSMIYNEMREYLVDNNYF